MSHVHGMEGPISILPASPRPATNNSQSCNTSENRVSDSRLTTVVSLTLEVESARPSRRGWPVPHRPRPRTSRPPRFRPNPQDMLDSIHVHAHGNVRRTVWTWCLSRADDEDPHGTARGLRIHRGGPDACTCVAGCAPSGQARDGTLASQSYQLMRRPTW